MRTALEPAAIAGVMSREVANFRTFWKATDVLQRARADRLPARVRARPRRDDRRPGRRPRLRRVRRHRDGRDGGDLLERAAGDVRHVRQAPLPEHLRRDPRRAGRRRGAGHRGDALDRDPRRRSTAASRCWSRCCSASTRRLGMLLVPFFCFVTALGFAGFGIAVAATRRQDRPVQLRDDAGRHAAVPGRRHLLPDRRAARGRPGRPRSSTRSTSSSSWSATPASASRRPTCSASRRWSSSRW